MTADWAELLSFALQQHSEAQDVMMLLVRSLKTAGGKKPNSEADKDNVLKCTGA